MSERRSAFPGVPGPGAPIRNTILAIGAIGGAIWVGYQVDLEAVVGFLLAYVLFVVLPVSIYRFRHPAARVAIFLYGAVWGGILLARELVRGEYYPLMGQIVLVCVLVNLPFVGYFTYRVLRKLNLLRDYLHCRGCDWSGGLFDLSYWGGKCPKCGNDRFEYPEYVSTSESWSPRRVTTTTRFKTHVSKTFAELVREKKQIWKTAPNKWWRKGNALNASTENLPPEASDADTNKVQAVADLGPSPTECRDCGRTVLCPPLGCRAGRLPICPDCMRAREKKQQEWSPRWESCEACWGSGKGAAPGDDECVNCGGTGKIVLDTMPAAIRTSAVIECPEA